MAGDLDADGVDDDVAAHAGRVQDCYFGGDPAADGVADDGDVSETEFVEQGDVDGGEAGDGVELAGARGSGETRVCRGEHVRGDGIGELVGPSGDSLGAAAAMHDEDGVALASLGYGDFDIALPVPGEVVGAGFHDYALWRLIAALR